MIAMGDEVRRTQHGNNNSYCHDDPSVWFGWSPVEQHAEMHRFVRLLIARRDAEDEQQRISLSEKIRRAKASWHGVKLNQPDWSENSRSFAFCAELPNQSLMIHLIVSAHWESLEFELPPLADGTRWRRWIDTFLPTFEDICDWDAAMPIPGATYTVGPRSVVVLLSPLP